MIYRVVTYDRETERMRGSLEIPGAELERAKQIAGFQPEHDGLGEYPLDEDQTRQIALLLGFRPEPNRFYYAVAPYEPPEEDTGLRRVA